MVTGHQILLPPNRISAEPGETCSVVPQTFSNTQTIKAQLCSPLLVFLAAPDHVCRGLSAPDLQSPG